jgi:uncharacterized membrane protein YhaH (DUF805 family)
VTFVCEMGYVNIPAGSGLAVSQKTFQVTFYFARLIVCIVTLPIPLVGAALNPGTAVPLLAVGARRLHETGRSGWWQLLNLLPVLGWIVLWIMLAQPAKVATTTSVRESGAPRESSPGLARWL